MARWRTNGIDREHGKGVRVCEDIAWALSECDDLGADNEMKQAMRSAEPLSTVAPANDSRRTSSITQRAVIPDWDASVVADILGFEYARAVLFTDGNGKILFRGGVEEVTNELAETAEIALSAVGQAGPLLSMGELDISVLLYRRGTLVAASSPSGLRAIVLAQANANLGQLLSHVRRIFTGSHG